MDPKAPCPIAPTASTEPPTVASLVEALDSDLKNAIADVDRTLIALTLGQSPWDRLRSAARMAQTLARIRDAAASQRG